MKKMVKTLLCLMMALAMSLSLAVPAFAVPCEHDYYDTVSVWYTDNGAANHIKHRQVTTRCRKCSYTNVAPESRTTSIHDIGPWIVVSSNHSLANPAKHYCIKQQQCNYCFRVFNEDRVLTGCTSSGCREYQRIDPVPVTV